MKWEQISKFTNPVSMMVEQALAWAEASLDVTEEQGRDAQIGVAPGTIRLGAGVEFPASLLQLPAQQLAPLYAMLQMSVLPGFVQQVRGFIDEAAEEIAADADEIVEEFGSIGKEEFTAMFQDLATELKSPQAAKQMVAVTSLYKKMLDKYSIEGLVNIATSFVKTLPPKTYAAMMEGYGSEDEYEKFLTDYYSCIYNTDVEQIMQSWAAADYSETVDALSDAAVEVSQKLTPQAVRTLAKEFSEAAKQEVTQGVNAASMAVTSILMNTASGNLFDAASELKSPFQAVAGLVTGLTESVESALEKADLLPDTNPFKAYAANVRRVYGF